MSPRYQWGGPGVLRQSRTGVDVAVVVMLAAIGLCATGVILGGLWLFGHGGGWVMLGRVLLGEALSGLAGHLARKAWRQGQADG